MSTQQQVAFVTGAASGIGRATAKAFVTKGYKTVLVDRDQQQGAATEKEFGELGDCFFVTCDVADDQSVKEAVDSAVSHYGRLDVAFNAAGIDGDLGHLAAECSMDNWQRVLGVNLTGVFSCMRYQIPHMLAAGGGAIVNCASVAGLLGAASMAAYVASKHGVVGITKSAALDYAKSGIMINAVCPAMIDTPMAQGLPQDVIDMLLSETPIGRYGQTTDVASLVLWLCDTQANQFLTGQAIAIDGGWTSR